MDERILNTKRWRMISMLRIWVLVFLLAIPARGAPPQRPQFPMPAPGQQQSQRPAVLDMRLDGGLVTATISDCYLQDVLRELAARTGIVFEVRTQENPLVSIKIYRISLQEAIERITPENNTIFVYGKGQRDPEQILLVRIFPRKSTSPQPSVVYLGTGAITKIDVSIDTPDQALKVLAESTSLEEKERAVEVLADSGGGKAIKGLIHSISDPIPEIRVAIIESLATLNARSALPSILKCFQDPSPSVRQSAATAVALLGSARNIKDLKQLSADRNPGVAAAAETAIRKLSASVR